LNLKCFRALETLSCRIATSLNASNNVVHSFEKRHERERERKKKREQRERKK
jgi:hypothetical protein